LDIDLVMRQMTETDREQIKQIIDLSFPRLYRFFAIHSLHEEGQVLVAETSKKVVGFAKLIDFHIENKKYGCILWIAVHPSYRRKRIAASLTNNGVKKFKQDGANAVFASTQRRNVAALSVLSLECFRRMSFFGLLHFFGWRVIQFYIAIWFAPGEIVLMHD
jgi:ribosomal protein S18 acetylase RimI-like enzyme